MLFVQVLLRVSLFSLSKRKLNSATHQRPHCHTLLIQNNRAVFKTPLKRLNTAGKPEISPILML